jgi:hypothetical protein
MGFHPLIDGYKIIPARKNLNPLFLGLESFDAPRGLQAKQNNARKSSDWRKEVEMPQVAPPFRGKWQAAWARPSSIPSAPNGWLWG